MKKIPHLKAFSRPISRGKYIHPAQTWFRLLSIATVLIGFSVVWNIWLLRSVEKGGTLGNEVPVALSDEAPVQSVRAVFESREKEEARYRFEYVFVDPSQ